MPLPSSSLAKSFSLFGVNAMVAMALSCSGLSCSKGEVPPPSVAEPRSESTANAVAGARPPLDGSERLPPAPVSEGAARDPGVVGVQVPSSGSAEPSSAASTNANASSDEVEHWPPEPSSEQLEALAAVASPQPATASPNDGVPTAAEPRSASGAPEPAPEGGADAETNSETDAPKASSGAEGRDAPRGSAAKVAVRQSSPTGGAPQPDPPETRREEPKVPALHQPWERLLTEYVSAAGWVDYVGLKRKDLKALDGYIAALGRTDVSKLSRDGAKAFWINAYNAVCVRTLIARDLPKTVPHAVLFGANIFKEENYRIGGAVRSLDEIEHEILRPKFADPRIHAAIVCGASSCPRLRAEAYVASRLDVQLDEEARNWINREVDKKGQRKNRLDRKAKTLYLSKIFDWFGEDFGDGDAALLSFVKRFADAPTREFLSKNRVRIRFLTYDWSLNRR